MISIILPTYNGQKYLGLSIKSIIDQTYSDWELIIIDDCSIDKTQEIAMTYSRMDNRIKYFRNERNLKLPASLNKGFSYSTGEYLTWTSDDNIFLSNALEVMYQYMKNNDVGLVFARQEIIDTQGDVRYIQPKVDRLDDLYFKNIVGACFLYRRDVYETVGDYDVSKFLIEDWDYWLRIYKKYDIGYIEAVLYQYRNHRNSLTEKKNFEIQTAAVTFLENVLGYEDITDYIKSNIYVFLIQKYFSIEKFDKMKLYYDRLKKEYPNMNSRVNWKYTIAYYLPNLIIKYMRCFVHSLKRYSKE